MSNNKINKRTLKGYVTSDKMDKTIVVRVDSYKQHPKYKKRFKVTNKYFAHDQSNQAHIGDFVQLIENRPISRHKKWLLKSILKPATAATVTPSESTDLDLNPKE